MKGNLKQDESHTNGAFTEHVRLNQQKLRAALKAQYDFIVCGSGSSGLVVAPRLAEPVANTDHVFTFPRGTDGGKP